MTITKSFYSLFTNSIGRLKGITIIYLLLSLILYPLQIFFEMHYSNNLYLYGNAEVYPAITMLFYPLVLALFAIIIPLFATSFLHKKNSATMFHSLPVSRKSLFFSNMLATFVMYLVPLVLTFSISAVMLFFDNSTLDTIMYVLIEMLCTAVSGILLITLTFLCAVLVSSTLDAFLLSGVFSVIIPCIYFLICVVLSGFLFGFGNDFNFDILMYSPLLQNYDLIDLFGVNTGRSLSVTPYVQYFIVAIIFAFLGYFAYKFRKTEFAENYSIKAIIYKFVVIISSFTVAMVGALISGAIEGGNFSLIISATLYSLITAICLCAIFSRNFKQNKHTIVTICISVFIPVAFMICTVTGWFGYESNVPEPSDIQSVEINIPSMLEELPYGDTICELTTYTSFVNVTALHQNIINTKDGELYVKYHLKNGMTISRNYPYSNNEDIHMEYILELNNEPEFKEQITPFFKEESIVDITIVNPYIDSITRNVPNKLKNELINAIQKDIADFNYETAYSQGQEALAVINCGIAKKTGIYDYKYVVTRSSMNTLNWLKENGYEEYTKRNLPINTKIITNEYNPSKDGNLMYATNWGNIKNVFLNNSYFSPERDNYKLITDKSEVDAILDQVSMYRQDDTFTQVYIVLDDVDEEVLKTGNINFIQSTTYQDEETSLGSAEIYYYGKYVIN